jgi:hypothetical protein
MTVSNKKAQPFGWAFLSEADGIRTRNPRIDSPVR